MVTGGAGSRRGVDEGDEDALWGRQLQREPGVTGVKLHSLMHLLMYSAELLLLIVYQSCLHLHNVKATMFGTHLIAQHLYFPSIL